MNGEFMTRKMFHWKYLKASQRTFGKNNLSLTDEVLKSNKLHRCSVQYTQFCRSILTCSDMTELIH